MQHNFGCHKHDYILLLWKYITWVIITQTRYLMTISFNRFGLACERKNQRLHYLYFIFVWEGSSLLEYCFERLFKSPSPFPLPPLRACSKAGWAAVAILYASGCHREPADSSPLPHSASGVPLQSHLLTVFSTATGDWRNSSEALGPPLPALGSLPQPPKALSGPTHSLVFSCHSLWPKLGYSLWPEIIRTDHADVIMTFSSQKPLRLGPKAKTWKVFFII